ncbi:MAG: hypothetical protein IJ783_09820, partial [Kiritimatiellae bacterium]|nr:hypothetical protein [Kiritimatiellia bacterium]
MPPPAPDSAIAAAVALSLLWGSVGTAWLVARSRLLARLSTWFRRDSASARGRGLSLVRLAAALALLVSSALFAVDKPDRGRPPGVPPFASSLSALCSSLSDPSPLRSLPDGLAASSNALAVTSFAVDDSVPSVSFGLAWATNLFDFTASREVLLFLSTNLSERGWFHLGS